VDRKVNDFDYTNQTNPVSGFLLSRHSCHQLSAPAPQADHLELILRAALKAPDFQTLRNYRFLIAENDGLFRLGQKMANAARTENKTNEIIRRVALMPSRAPMVITIVATPKKNKHVSALDQILCAASAVLMMQLTALSLGYNGIWRSGWMMQSRALHQELHLQPEDQIVGFLYLGTPLTHEKVPAPATDPYAYTEWL
jgi:Nitroreductase